ncbi:TPA: IgG-binding virulence factor TspB family protein [Neisseria subflava]
MEKLYLSQNQLIRLIILILMSFLVNNSYAEWKSGPPFPGSNGTVRPLYDSSKVNLNPNTMYKTDTGHYGFKTTISQTIEHVPTGATRAGVPIIFEAQVSRKAVLSGAFRLVKAGAKLALKGVPYVGTAYTLYEAYQAVNPTLESAGYHYSANADTYLKVYDNALCLGKFMNQPGYYSCIGVDSSVMLALSKGGQSKKDAINLLTMQVKSDYEKIHKDLMDAYFKSDNYSSVSPKCIWNGWGVSCHIQTLSIAYGFIKNYSEELTPDKFLEIATNTIDSNPTPFVEGTGKPEYKENIKVPAGTVVTIGPVETPEGKKTYTVTFTNPTNGGSSEASVQTNNSPAPTGNNGGSPDGKPDGKPDGNPDKNPSGKDGKDRTDGKDGKDGKDAQDLCEKHPEASACKDLGDTDYKDLEIPEKAINLELKPLDIFSTNGTCPANPTFSLGVLGTFEIPYDYFCNIARLLRPILILGTIIMCGFFAFNAVKEL